VVFTIPDCIAQIALQNQRVLYNILFRAASKTLLTIAADPKHLGAEIGFIALLHTWGQNLLLHPHIHCVVPGGGLAPDKSRWVSCRKGFFLPVRVLSRLFRRLFIEYLEQAFERAELVFHGQLQHLSQAQAFAAIVKTASQTEWVVYAKPPLGGPAQVLDYLGHYTHRIAISNHRLVSLEQGRVSFQWKDYSHGNAIKTMTIEASEFIRRFLLHVLPNGFQRIRHFGFLSNRYRDAKLTLCRQFLNVQVSVDTKLKESQDWKARYELLTGRSVDACPVCRSGRMAAIEILLPVSHFQPKPGVDSS